MKSANSALFVLMILCTALYVSAQEETSTEIQGFYQSYRNFSYYSGDPYYSFSPTKLNGGGFMFARNLASYFAMWTQFTFYGSAEKDLFKLGIMNNLQGLRFQTKLHGPFRFYAKGGIGFTRYSIDMVLDNVAAYSYSDSSFSVGYGGGAQIWLGNRFGIVLDATNVHMGLPNLLDADLPDREKWDSGMTYTTGLALRF